MHESKNIQIWLMEWFYKRNRLASIDPASDFYSQELIDSFGIFELINDLESTFSFRFLDEDFKEPDFRTVDGLTQIIAKRL